MQKTWSWLAGLLPYNPKPPTAGDDDDRGDDPEAVSASLPPPPPTQARQARDKPTREDLVGVAARCCCVRDVRCHGEARTMKARTAEAFGSRR